MKYSAAAAAVGALAARGVHASPFPQAVTDTISPSAAAPSGCSASYTGSFGIAVVAIASSSSSVATPSIGSASNATANLDIQAAAVTPSSSSAGVYIVSQISDGQIQAPTAGETTTPSAVYTPVPTPDYTSVTPISEISDGQPQAPASTPTPSTPLTPLTPPTPIASPSTPAATTVIPISEISDGQPQAPASTPVVAATTLTPIVISTPTADAATSIAAVSQISDGQIQSPGSAKRSLTACAGSSTLTLTLAGGVLLDAKNRTGYIASNYQFQFDGPPQSGALYTAGFSVCEDGKLALGGSKTWWRCLSGEFYNLYDRYWAEQCEEVAIEIVELEECE